MKTLSRALSTLLLIAPLLAMSAEPDAIVGTWTTAEDKSKVEIFKKDNQYYGKIVALKEPLFPNDPNHRDFVAGREGQPKVDRRNPEENLRERSVVGMEIMAGFKHGGEDVWSGGTIYDPESGKTYQCKVTLVSPKELKVRGFIGISLLGRTTVWTR
jgi:uncharacterized protein (DUF2147 family)